VDKRYYVTVNYEPAAPGEIPDGGDEPIGKEPDVNNREALMWWDREITTRNEPHDNSLNVVRTFSNNLYEELVQRDRTKGLLVIEFNVPTIGQFIDLSRTFDQATNSTTWNFKGRSLPPRTALIREISANPNRAEGDDTYYPQVMRIAFADVGKTWDVPMAEMSQFHFTKTSGNYDLDANGFRKRTDAGSPVPLNADGTRRDDSQPIMLTNWRIEKEADFNQLVTYFDFT
jgi:hypothetical protein